eukprot:COSAG06_NODE_629_length_13646_cov_13.351222_1_plen_84_part_10
MSPLRTEPRGPPRVQQGLRCPDTGHSFGKPASGQITVHYLGKIRLHLCNVMSESESDLFTGTIHGNTDCYLQFCAPRLPQGAVS